jgi:diketogulonate reductase-like aldo/keto reductase
MLQRKIPSSGELLPVLGLGTWKKFDVTGTKNLNPLSEVLEIMQEAGGRIIDSSPMYGNSEKVIGELTADPIRSNYFFFATKVWTSGKMEGIQQLESSFQKMKRTSMDLVQVHNLLDWKIQLQTLREWKSQGRIRYIGITHYTDAYHDELSRILSAQTIDFVQFNYSLFSTHAENGLLDLAADRGVGVLINRPFGEGSAFLKVKKMQLPLWVTEYGIKSWGQFFLLYIISHTAVNAVIPATGNPDHARENFRIPELDEMTMADLRKKIAIYSKQLL